MQDDDSSSSSSESENEANDKYVTDPNKVLSLQDDEGPILISNYDNEEEGEAEEDEEEDDLRPETSPDSRPYRSLDLSRSKLPAADTADEDKQKQRKRRKKLYICLTNCKYPVVRQASKRFGFKIVDEDEDWHLYWTDSSVTLDRVLDMKRYQKINHFPGMSEICRKDFLSRNLNRMLKAFPKDYNIFPRSWCLPADYADFQTYSRQHRHKTYILKPDSSCQGKGIWITKNPMKVSPHEDMVCQLYLTKPYLVDGFKFDLRIYVLVASIDPLRIFVYKEGLARFCTKPYKEPTNNNCDDIFLHLTNYAVQKRSSTYNVDEEAGTKRRITTVNKYLRENGGDVDRLWSEIDDIIIKTVISAYAVLRHNYRTCFPQHAQTSACFEILGFDVIVDHKLRPQVLEVNHSPSFTTDQQIDKDVKLALIYDTMNLVNFSMCDKRKIMAEDRKKFTERLMLKSFKKESREDIEAAEADFLQSIARWEDTHLGNFRRIFPIEGRTEKYDRFCTHGSSLFTETAACKARAECSRQQREEIFRKQQQLSKMLRKNPVCPESPDRRPSVPRGSFIPGDSQSVTSAQRQLVSRKTNQAAPPPVLLVTYRSIYEDMNPGFFKFEVPRSQKGRHQKVKEPSSNAVRLALVDGNDFSNDPNQNQNPSTIIDSSSSSQVASMLTYAFKWRPVETYFQYQSRMARQAATGQGQQLQQQNSAPNSPALPIPPQVASILQGQGASGMYHLQTNFIPATPPSHLPGVIDEQEEIARLSALMQRENLIRKLGIVDLIRVIVSSTSRQPNNNNNNLNQQQQMQQFVQQHQLHPGGFIYGQGNDGKSHSAATLAAIQNRLQAEDPTSSRFVVSDPLAVVLHSMLLSKPASRSARKYGKPFGMGPRLVVERVLSENNIGPFQPQFQQQSSSQPQLLVQQQQRGPQTPQQQVTASVKTPVLNIPTQFRVADSDKQLMMMTSFPASMMMVPNKMPETVINQDRLHIAGTNQQVKLTIQPQQNGGSSFSNNFLSDLSAVTMMGGSIIRPSFNHQTVLNNNQLTQQMILSANSNSSSNNNNNNSSDVNNNPSSFGSLLHPPSSRGNPQPGSMVKSSSMSSDVTQHNGVHGHSLIASATVNLAGVNGVGLEPSNGTTPKRVRSASGTPQFHGKQQPQQQNQPSTGQLQAVLTGTQIRTGPNQPGQLMNMNNHFQSSNDELAVQPIAFNNGPASNGSLVVRLPGLANGRGLLTTAPPSQPLFLPAVLELNNTTSCMINNNNNNSNFSPTTQNGINGSLLQQANAIMTVGSLKPGAKAQPPPGSTASFANNNNNNQQQQLPSRFKLLS